MERAVALDPSRWRHHLRLAYGTWGEAWRAARARVPRHAMARAGLALLGDPPPVTPEGDATDGVDAAFAQAAFTIAPPGNAGWLLAVEPWLQGTAQSDAWVPALTAVCVRAGLRPES